ncbi:MAG: purine-nucleoside phosphorylase [Kiritimatiellae bacterium]|nr:purine-nucleoside phosphorylase [Kiritimatiellia bacterium]
MSIGGPWGGVDAERLAAAVEAVRRRWPDVRPAGGMVLGSGWSSVAESFEARDAMRYDDIPALGAPTVEGHGGRLIRATVRGGDLLIFAGRRHFYEGEGWTPVVAPVHILLALGASRLLLTNAAGGIAPHWRPGDMMVIRDHLHLMGSNPLMGPPLGAWGGVRFPAMTDAYSPRLRETLLSLSRAAGVRAAPGVYAALSGPMYETPAEVEWLRRIGADAVGMSTTPEVIVARAAGIEVAGVSCISNLAAGAGAGAPSHEEVTATLRAAAPAAARWLRAFWEAELA